MKYVSLFILALSLLPACSKKKAEPIVDIEEPMYLDEQYADERYSGVETALDLK